LVLESEMIAALWRCHPPAAVDKLVSEILWRTYWKGWLEHHPSVWAAYLGGVAAARDDLGGGDLDRYSAALEGRTGIDCFDAWMAELTDCGYLHNHARLWFASIWTFTLGLPWTLGAALFLRHLRDGDPASNTLSWRWVAGLHTRGKHYLARADNIARFTRGRFDPAGQLVEDAGPVRESGPEPQRRAPRPAGRPDPGARSLLLITSEDLTPELSDLTCVPIDRILGGWDRDLETELDLAPGVSDFTRMALDDALGRAAVHFGLEPARLDPDHWLEDAKGRILACGLRQVVTLETPVGPWCARVDRLEAGLVGEGVRLIRVRRPWDSILWPGATGGFFRFRDHARACSRLQGLTGGPIAGANPDPG
jgi:deoxyribodipyrimidine photo-lyase